MRKTRLGALVALVSMTALAACSGGSSGTSDTAKSDGGGTVKVASQSLPPSLGNPLATVGQPGGYVWPAIFDSLTQVDEKGFASPGVATSWEVVDKDNLTWNFKLRDDITFSNGEKLDATAVSASIDYLLKDPVGKTTSLASTQIANVESTKVADDYTVEIRTKIADPVLPAKLSALFVVPPKYFAEAGAEGFATKPIGSGPFKAKSWSATQIELERNPDSWRTATIDALEFRVIEDTTARVQAVTSGQINLALNLAPDQVESLEKAGTDVHVSDEGAVTGLQFVTVGKDNPFQDKRVRLALNHAVNTQAIADTLLAGLTGPSGQSATEGTFGYNPDVKPYEYDPEKAKALLAEAGYADGFKFTAEMASGEALADTTMQAIKADLAKVGVEMTAETMPFPAFLEKFNNAKWDGDAFYLVWTNSPQMDALRPYANYSCLRNPASYCDEDAMPLIEAAQGGFDEAEREKALKDLMAYSHENPPSIFLYPRIGITGVNGLKDFDMRNYVIDWGTVGRA